VFPDKPKPTNPDEIGTATIEGVPDTPVFFVLKPGARAHVYDIDRADGREIRQAVKLGEVHSSDDEAVEAAVAKVKKQASSLIAKPFKDKKCVQLESCIEGVLSSLLGGKLPTKTEPNKDEDAKPVPVGEDDDESSVDEGDNPFQSAMGVRVPRAKAAAAAKSTPAARKAPDSSPRGISQAPAVSIKREGDTPKKGEASGLHLGASPCASPRPAVPAGPAPDAGVGTESQPSVPPKKMAVGRPRKVLNLIDEADKNAEEFQANVATIQTNVQPFYSFNETMQNQSDPAEKKAFKKLLTDKNRRTHALALTNAAHSHSRTRTCTRTHALALTHSHGHKQASGCAGEEDRQGFEDC
jgi:hypothetical protein